MPFPLSRGPLKGVIYCTSPKTWLVFFIFSRHEDEARWTKSWTRFCCFFPFHYLRPSFLSLLVVIQIRGHIAGSSPPSPLRTVSCVFIDSSHFFPRRLASNCVMVLWYILSPVAALWFIASVPSWCLAGVIACLDEGRLGLSLRRHPASKQASN